VRNSSAELTIPSITFSKELSGFGLIIYYLSEAIHTFAFLIVFVAMVVMCCKYGWAFVKKKKRRKRREGAVLTPPAAFVRLAFDGLGASKANKVI